MDDVVRLAIPQFTSVYTQFLRDNVGSAFWKLA